MINVSENQIGQSGMTQRAQEGEDLHQTFHSQCGQLIRISGCRRSASRSHASQEFNHGLVFSSAPLVDDQIFEIRIDKKIDSWSGSLELGVTTCDPDSLTTSSRSFPSSANELLQGSSWIMSGNTVRQDGKSVHENYGPDLDQVNEQDRVGVVRTSQGDLVFFVNGVSQSVAAAGIPQDVWAVVDLYGKCAAVTITDPCSDQERRILANDLSNEATAAAAAAAVNCLSSSGANHSQHNVTNRNIAAMTALGQEAVPSYGRINNHNLHKIRFHDRRGALVRLSNNQRTAERKRPFDEFNHGVVMTHRPLNDDELFELRIDRLVDKWSGSIEVGITTHNPSNLDFPATMTNQRSGTMMMSGCGILTNGKGTRRKYGDFNLDELSEGDRIGLMRKANGNLHFYINGLDQGVAATRVPTQMWGVVDLYGMTVKVTIVDRDEREEHNLITRRNLVAQGKSTSIVADEGSFQEFVDNRLLFHPNCGTHAAVISSGTVAHRPNASDDFNFGVVLTNRPLKSNEVFEVRLDKMVTKWAGSIEIGVTTHAPNDLEFPSTMTNIRSGTWMMTGNGVMHNGTTVIDDYGQNLDKLKVGDRVAVVRKDNGTLHFFVNSDDQGPAASNVPENVYGVIDLYGQAAQATIIDLSEYRSPDVLAGNLVDSDVVTSTSYSTLLETSDLRFHHLHGRNSRISNSGLTASRPHALNEFNDAIVMSNRPLRDGEMFEIVIERMVERWSGAIEAGVTVIRPEDLEFPSTMTDIDYDTWMLSGSAIMRDGQTVLNGYCCDLDGLSVGSRLGMVRHSDGTLHYTINGEDQGIACSNIPSGVYAVVDLYGQCAQVSIVHHPTQPGMSASACVTSSQHLQASCSSIIPGQHLTPIAQYHQENNSLASSQVMDSSHISLAFPGSEVNHRFARCDDVELRNNNTSCTLRRDCLSATVYGSNAFNENTEDIFEIRIDEVNQKLAGSLKVGMTTIPLEESKDVFGIGTLWLEGSHVFSNGSLVKPNYCRSLDRLAAGDKIAVKRHSDGTVRFLINGNDCGPIAVSSSSSQQKNRRKWPFVQLCGATKAVSVVSSTLIHSSPSYQGLDQPQQHLSVALHRLSATNQMLDSLEVIMESGRENMVKTDEEANLKFHENHGRNVQFREEATAFRTDSYNQGIAITNRPLKSDEVFQIKVEKLNPRWSSSLSIGILLFQSDNFHLPITALGLKKNSIVLSGDGGVYYNGQRISQYNTSSGLKRLDTVVVGTCIGVSVDSAGYMRIHLDGKDKGAIMKCPFASNAYGIVDLYGQCEQVSIVPFNGVDTTVTKRPEKTVCCHATVESREQCKYLLLCQKFMTSLALPSSYFGTKAVCYCENCYQGEAYLKKGDPPKDYAVPLGWVYFPIKQKPLKKLQASEEESNASKSTSDDWHKAYHGSKPGMVRKLLDNGELVPMGKTFSNLFYVHFKLYF